MLPVFSEALQFRRPIDGRFRLMTEATVLAAAIYLCIFLIAGQVLIPLVFGPQYHDLGAVTGWLAAMWSVRMIQAVPGMALMAHGITKPFAVAGFIRAAALPFALAAAMNGAPVAAIAAIGCVFEIASLLYVAMRMDAVNGGLGQDLLLRSLYLVPVALASYLATRAGLGTHLQLAMTTTAMALLAGGIATAIMPALRGQLRTLMATRLSPADAA
jgi:hypothetical protein